MSISPGYFCRCALAVTMALGSFGSVTEAQVIVNRASTVGESEARGLADVVRSQGQFNLQSSHALINGQEARRQEIENELRQTEVFFERRALNQQQRFGDYPERAARNAERASRDAQQSMIRYGQAGRPRRLTSRELDPLTGRVTWPMFLQAPTYAKPRQSIDAIMRARADQEDVLSLEQFQTFMAATQQMSDTLSSKIWEKNSMDFINTRNFINRLVYEVRNPGT